MARAAALALPARHGGVLPGPARVVLLEHTAAVLARPTAPYAEDLQVAYVRAFVAARPGLELREDEHANLAVTWPGRRGARRRAPLAFSAHLDHPGFHYAGRRGGVHAATVHGGVPTRHAPGAAIAFFDRASGDTLARARVRSIQTGRGGTRRALLDAFEGAAPRGTPGAFDLGPPRLVGTRLSAPACDDLMGAAAILALLDLARAEGLALPVTGLFTRAEETGFVGCQGLLRAGALPRGTHVVGLECSAHRASARLGAGPVIRVGDASTVFDPALTHHLQAAAAALAERCEGWRHQRALMDGGRCESTAYNLWGVPAGGLCLALLNYHNAGERGARAGRIAPEAVDWRDHEGLLALMLEAARTWGATAPGARMRRGLDRVWALERGRLADSAKRLRSPARAARTTPDAPRGNGRKR